MQPSNESLSRRALQILGTALVAAPIMACGSSPVGSPVSSGGGDGTGSGTSASFDAGSSASAGGGGGDDTAAAGDDAGASTPVSTPDAGRGDGGGARSAADAGLPPSRKRGIAYGYNSDADLAALSAGIGWWYNWSPAPDSTLTKGIPSDVEFVPMIWGGTFNTTTLATQVPDGAKYLLTFNEPNFGAQSNLTPQQAAALWPQVEAFAKAKNLAIVSPALNYCGGSCNETSPFTWLDDFFAACTGCQVDYVAAHWYACSQSALTGYLSEYETKYKKPIWLTEFSCLDGSQAATDANEETYMKTALATLEADPMVFRYSWFTGRSTSTPAISVLDTASGALTALGQTYVSFPAQ